MVRSKLTEGAEGRALLGLAGPMAVGMTSMFVVQILEIWLVAQLGTLQLAALTFTFPLVFSLNSIAFGIGIGCSSLMSRAIGASQMEDARRIATHALVLVGLLMSVGAVVGILLVDPLFTAMGAKPEVLVEIHNYLDLYLPASVLLVLGMIMSNIQRAAGNARVPATLMTVGSGLQALLLPVLVFGLFGLPRLELAGVAVAMLTARLLMAAVGFFWLVRVDRLLTRHVEGLLDSVRRILAIGVPAMLTQLIVPVTSGIITAMLAAHGEVSVAGFGVATRIEGLLLLPLFALSASIGPFSGQNWGAGNLDRVYRGLRLTNGFCLAWGLATWAVLFLWGSTLAGLFDDDPGVVAAAGTYLALVPISYGAWGLLMMASATFNALGWPIPSTCMSAVRMFVLYVPLAWLLEHWFGLHGIFLATVLSNVVMGLIGYFWIHQRLAARAPAIVAR